MSLHDPQDLTQAPRHVIALAHFMRDPGAPAEMVAFLEEVDRRWPGLSFRDFFGAAALAEALALKTEGSA
jgi:hypothetical protein